MKRPKRHRNQPTESARILARHLDVPRAIGKNPDAMGMLTALKVGGMGHSDAVAKVLEEIRRGKI